MHEIYEYYPVSSYQITAAASDTSGRIPVIDALKGQLDKQSKAAVDAAEGQLQTSVQDAPAQAKAHADSITQKATFAAGALVVFANAVDTFDSTSGPKPRSVSKLNSAYFSAEDNDFGQPASVYPEGATAAEKTKIDDTWSTGFVAKCAALRKTLDAEYTQLHTNIDHDADHVAKMLKEGPTPANLKEMYAAGALPSYVGVIFPNIDFSGVVVKALPYDLRYLADDQLIDWFLKHPDQGGAYVGALTPQLRQTLGQKVAQQAKDVGDVDSVDDRKKYDQIATLLLAYGADKEVARGFFKNVSPSDLVDIMNHLTYPILDGNPDHYYLDQPRVGNVGAEHDALLGMQDRMGNALALLLATGSRNNELSKDYGKEFAGRNSIYAAVLLKYGDSKNLVYGGDFLGDVVAGSENDDQGDDYADYQHWSSYSIFGKQFDFSDTYNHNAVTQALNAADNSVESSQQFWMNDEATKYVLSERDDDHDEGQTEKLLTMATIEQTNSPDDATAKRASEVSSNLIDVLADHKPKDRYDDEVASVISTYIADADRTVTIGSDGRTGVYANGPDAQQLPPWLRGDSGLPKYGIYMDKGDLTKVLEDIGDNDTAKSIIGDATGKYNQVRMDYGADQASHYAANDPWKPQTDGDPFMHATSSSSQLTGYMENSLVNGDVSDAKDRAEEREQVAKFFLSPLGYVPKGGPVGDFIVGSIEDQLIKQYVVGDDVNNTVDQGNTSFEAGREQTKLDAYYSLVNANSNGSHYQLGGLGSGWPTDDSGHPLPPGQLSKGQVTTVLTAAENSPGYPQAIDTSVDQSYDNQTKQFGGN